MMRSTRWRKPRPIVRPGTTPPLPKGWKALCVKVLVRDKGQCRRCCTPRMVLAIDHVIPRRLLRGAEVGNRRNLAALCAACHAWKTHTLEPQLYKADVLAFDQFLGILQRSGPTPAPILKARAYARLRETLYA